MIKLCLWCGIDSHPFPTPMFLALTLLITGPEDGPVIFPWRLLASVAVVCPVSCLLVSWEHWGTAICPQPHACPSFLDHRQSSLIPQGKGPSLCRYFSLTFSTILMITVFLGWSAVLVSLCSLLSVCSLHLSMAHISHAIPWLNSYHTSWHSFLSDVNEVRAKIFRGQKWWANS